MLVIWISCHRNYMDKYNTNIYVVVVYMFFVIWTDVNGLSENSKEHWKPFLLRFCSRKLWKIRKIQHSIQKHNYYITNVNSIEMVSKTYKLCDIIKMSIAVIQMNSVLYSCYSWRYCYYSACIYIYCNKIVPSWIQ